jgi:hypothetical protein
MIRKRQKLTTGGFFHQGNKKGQFPENLDEE